MSDTSTRNSKKQNSNLIWLDMEMTGLSVEKNVIIEVAVVITDSDLNILDETPGYVIHQSESELKKMDKWNVGTHTKSGLLEKVRESTYTTAEIEAKL
jgi:oligoribonuclease